MLLFTFVVLGGVSVVWGGGWGHVEGVSCAAAAAAAVVVIVIVVIGGGGGAGGGDMRQVTGGGVVVVVRTKVGEERGGVSPHHLAVLPSPPPHAHGL